MNPISPSFCTTDGCSEILAIPSNTAPGHCLSCKGSAPNRVSMSLQLFPSQSPAQLDIHDHIVKIVHAFIGDNVGAIPPNGQLEIEAKFGLLIDKNTGSRIYLPILSETVLAPGTWYRFESNMPPELHKRFNEVFNLQVLHSTKPEYKSSRWTYQREKTIDSFYYEAGRKIRISHDPVANKVVGAIEKNRIADLALHFPTYPLDARISINAEVPVEWNQSLAVTTTKNITRFKNRMSYTCEFLRVDLTQVDQKSDDRGNANSSTLLHELELEVLDATRLTLNPVSTESFVNAIRDVASRAGL